MVGGWKPVISVLAAALCPAALGRQLDRVLGG